MVRLVTEINPYSSQAALTALVKTEHRRSREDKVPQAKTVLKHLFGIDPNSHPCVYEVKFRDPDGGVGRRDLATHWIHWYPAKMFHRIPQAILSSLSPQSPLVILDPFCGSGTVLLEGILRGHDVVGIDVNPIARLISRVKTNSINPRHLRLHLAAILRRARLSPIAITKDAKLDFWFKPRIRAVLHNIFRSIAKIDHPGCREFFEITFSSVIRQASLADPRIPPPVRLNPARLKTANKKYQNDLERASNLRVPDVYELFNHAVDANLCRMEELSNTPNLGRATILTSEFEAANTGLPSSSVDLVMTSPPYCGAQKYARSLRLEMLMMNISDSEVAEVDRRTLGTERITRKDILNARPTPFAEVNDLIDKIRLQNDTRATMLAHYGTYLDEFAREVTRVLRPGGHAFVTFGTDRMAGINVNCAEIFVHAAIANGLRHIATLVDVIPSRGMITRRHSTASTIAEEHVVWVRSLPFSPDVGHQ